ncbi:peptidylprolyl isomerase [Flavobacterium album]|uniref:peptidylprolyl isomerase n=1 Tax=Flavobacterium album TaxID=2175091 RepID=A0A2S1R1Y0_9FLAO|nr:peptidylprolyl isomerase [Flavobacterium album]AWH86680.1 peptidylprolyl isomerase [Flavobacterium album]
MKKITLILLSLVFFAFTDFDSVTERSPETYTAKFETTKGDFIIEVNRKWSPNAADRLYELIKDGYYDNTLFYRVVPDFVVQFGSTDTLKMKKWSTGVPDEEVLLGNKKGTISFARLGKDSRSADLFINLKDNTRLDTITFEGVKGFPAFGNVTKGMDVVEQLYSGYGDNTLEDENLYGDRELFKKAFPKLDGIKRAYLVK